MHTMELSREALQHLWANYWILGQQFDVDRMPTDHALEIIRKPRAYRSCELASWLATQGFFISVWSLWEYHSRGLCDNMANKVSEKGKSHVNWVADSFNANGKIFSEHTWFQGGNALRNLIAHHGSRVASEGAERWWEKAKTAFPDITINPQAYIQFNHIHASTLMWKVDEFLIDPCRKAD